MFSDLKKLGRESLVYGFSTILARLLNFFLVPFYTYALTAAEYGVAASVFAYVAFFNVVFQYGMDQAYMRFSSDKETGDTLAFSTAFWSVLSTSVLLSLPLWLFPAQIAAMAGIGAENAVIVRYCAAVLTLDALMAVPFARLRMQHRAWFYVGVRTASIVVNVLANVLLLGVFHFKSDGVFLASLLASGVTFLLLLPCIIQALSFRFPRPLWSGMLHFAWPFVPSGLASTAVQVINRPMMLFLTDQATVGIYQANYRLGVFMMLVVSMFDQAWRPFFLERKDRPDARQLFARVLTYFFAGIVWLSFALSFFIPALVKMPIGHYHLIHPSYWHGLSIMPVVMAGYCFYGLYVNFMASIVLSKKTPVLLWATLAGAAVNIVLNLVLIPVSPMMGAAWATLFAYAVMALVLFERGRCCYPIPYEYPRLLKIALASLVLLAAALAAGHRAGWMLQAGLLLAFPILLAAMSFFDQPEKAAIKRILIGEH